MQQRVTPRVLLACQTNIRDTYLRQTKQQFLPNVQCDQLMSMQDYEKLPDKYAYDAMMLHCANLPFVTDVLEDQAKHSPRMNWVHSLTHGVDNYLKAETFQHSKVI